jgi:hypothetical protein
MNINTFDYLDEEANLIEGKLADLLLQMNEKSREQVFDDVKLICDNLQGYCQKQAGLLLDNIITDKQTEYSSELEATLKSRDKLITDLGDLVMVHVDEPGYRAYLEGLFDRARTYFGSSRSLYKKLKESLPIDLLNRIDSELTNIIHNDVGYNALQDVKIGSP